MGAAVITERTVLTERNEPAVNQTPNLDAASAARGAEHTQSPRGPPLWIRSSDRDEPDRPRCQRSQTRTWIRKDRRCLHGRAEREQATRERRRPAGEHK